MPDFAVNVEFLDRLERAHNETQIWKNTNIQCVRKEVRRQLKRNGYTDIIIGKVEQL